MELGPEDVSLLHREVSLFQRVLCTGPEDVSLLHREVSLFKRVLEKHSKLNLPY